MKLIGSKTEQEIRQLLIKSNQLLFKSEGKKRLLEVIKRSFPEMKAAYILEWIPEQGEDIYTLLINDSTVTEIEMYRNDHKGEAMVQTIAMRQYLKGLSKQDQIKLAVSLDLAEKDLKETN